MSEEYRRYIKSDNFRFSVISFLQGGILFHKIALLNKHFRKQLPQSGLLDQIISITVKKELSDIGETFFPFESFIYAVKLADCFEVQINP